MKTLIVASLLMFTALTAQAQSKAGIKWPVPKNVPGLLFYIQRDPDINTVCYALKTLPDGTVDQDEPVEIFWMKYATDGKKKKLNALQREFGYGLSITADSTDSFQMKAVAFPNRKMRLLKNGRDQFEVQMKISEQNCILQRVYIRITGGTALSPDVAYIEFFGRNTETGQAVAEKVDLQ